MGSVPEGEEIFPSNEANLDPGVNSDEEENIDDIFQVSKKYMKESINVQCNLESEAKQQ